MINILRFSPVLVGSTIGSSVGLVLSVFNGLSDSALSSTVLLGSCAVDFSTSSCESVLIVESLSCSSDVLAFSPSVFDGGASRTTIIDLSYISWISQTKQKNLTLIQLYLLNKKEMG